MSYLRQAVVAGFIEAHDNGAFTKADFKFETPTNSSTVFSSTFKHDSKYKFAIAHSERTWVIKLAPGAILAEERVVFSDLAGIPSLIETWVSRIREDLRASNFSIRELDAMAEKLNKEIQDHIKDPHLHFSKDELNQVKDQLNEILKQFVELKEKNDLTESELKTIKQDIEQLKSNAEFLNKGTFFATATNKLKNLTDSKAFKVSATKLIAAATNKALETVNQQ